MQTRISGQAKVWQKLLCFKRAEDQEDIWKCRRGKNPLDAAKEVVHMISRRDSDRPGKISGSNQVLRLKKGLADCAEYT